MLGFLLVISSSFLNEVSDIIAKKKIEAHQVSVYTTGFLISIFGAFFLLLSGFLWGDFHFSFDSSPTLLVRIVLEVFLAWITIVALTKANRSTFGFMRTLTMPLLLIADIVIGYDVSSKQILGVIIITAVIISFVSLSDKFEKRGVGLLLVSAILPVATLSLYKYDISHFNSVEAEQIVVSCALLTFFFLMAVFKSKENPFKFLVKPVFFLQAAAVGLASAIGSFAYAFLPPSIAVSILRSSSVLFATLSGNFYFKEKKPLLKILLAVAIVLGLVLLLV